MNFTQAANTTVTITGALATDNVSLTVISPYGEYQGPVLTASGAPESYSFFNPNGYPVVWSHDRTFPNDPYYATARANTKIEQYSAQMPSPSQGSTVTVPAIDTSLKFTTAPESPSTAATCTGGILTLEPAGGAMGYIAMYMYTDQDSVQRQGFIFARSNTITLPSWLPPSASAAAQVIYYPIIFSSNFEFSLPALSLFGKGVPGLGMAQMQPAATGVYNYAGSGLTF